MEAVFHLLVFSSVLYPDSKKAAFEHKHIFFGKCDFQLFDIYRALDIFAKEEKELQTWIFIHSKDDYYRDLSHSYFDCTNYCFEIEYNDDDLIDENGAIIRTNNRKRGPKKNTDLIPSLKWGS